MNRSFLIIALPGVAVATAYLLVMVRLGLAVEPFRLLGAAAVAITAVLLVLRHERRHERRKTAGRSR